MPDITVSNIGELKAALVAANAGKKILVMPGRYLVDTPLVVPDGVDLHGMGAMQFAEEMPLGFLSGTESILVADKGLDGDIVTLGNGCRLAWLRIEDVVRPDGTLGNLVVVGSRGPGDHVAATVEECELLNRNPSRRGPWGPAGRTLVAINRVTADNVHDKAVVTATMRRTLVQSPGGGSGVFAINFAQSAHVTVELENNVIGGGIDANAGVSRPRSVTHSRIDIRSHSNLYVSDNRAGLAGWILNGGSSAPAAEYVAEATSRNVLTLRSRWDEIRDFDVGIEASGGWRHKAADAQVDGNRCELDIENLALSSRKRDLSLIGAKSTDKTVDPGSGNLLKVALATLRASGRKENIYRHKGTAAGDALTPVAGNSLEFQGDRDIFRLLNKAIDPPPGPAFFTIVAASTSISPSPAVKVAG